MGMRVIDIETWKRKKCFDFFVKMVDPLIAVTASINVDKCYLAAKARGRSFFIYYCHAIMRTLNEIDEFHYRIVSVDGKLEVHYFDKVDLATPISTSDDGGFAEVRIPYSPDIEEFYAAAVEVIASASLVEDPIVKHIPNETYAVISALPFLNFTFMKSTLKTVGGVDQSTLISVGMMTKVNGSRTMPLAISVNHALMDGYHLGKFYSRVQELLDSF